MSKVIKHYEIRITKADESGNLNAVVSYIMTHTEFPDLLKVGEVVVQLDKAEKIEKEIEKIEKEIKIKEGLARR